ncbi:MAG: ribosome maturation factor RimP [Acidimicrobiales bacterium]
MTVADRVRDIVLSVLSSHGVDLYDLEVQGPLVRVVVDQEGGVDLDVLAAVTRAVSRALDDADPIPSRYTLEVTSPGVERRLRSPEQFVRAVGEVVKVRTTPDVPGDRRVQGVLAVADDEGITVRTEPEAGDDQHEPSSRTLAYGEIERARTVFEWGTPKKQKRERRS